MAKIVLLISVLVVSLLAASALAEHREVTLEGDDVVFRIRGWGFKKGATASVSVLENFGAVPIPSNSTGFQFVLCHDGDYVDMLKLSDEEICADPLNHCAHQAFWDPLQSQWNVTWTIGNKDRYFLATISCPPQVYEIDMEMMLRFLNPGGQELEYGTIPLPGILLFFTLLYTGVMVVWGINWWRYREQKARLHLVFWLFVGLNWMFLVLATGYYYELRGDGDGHVQLGAAALGFLALAEGVFWAALLMVSRGWDFARRRMEKAWLVILILFGLYVILRLIALAYGGWASLFPFLVLMACIILLFVWSKETTMLVQAALERLGPQGVADNPVAQRLMAVPRMLSRFRLFVTVFLVYIFVMDLLYVVFYPDYLWVSFFLYMLGESSFVAAMGLTFRLRAKQENIYYELYDYMDVEGGGEGGGSGGEGGGDAGERGAGGGDEPIELTEDTITIDEEPSS